MIFRVYRKTNDFEGENKLDKFFLYKGFCQFYFDFYEEVISRLTIRSFEPNKYRQIISYCYHVKIWPIMIKFEHLINEFF